MKFLALVALLVVAVNADDFWQNKGEIWKRDDLYREEIWKRGLISSLLGGGGKTASEYISCCSSLPMLDSMVNEVNQLRLNVQGCQGRLADIVNKMGGVKTDKRDYREKFSIDKRFLLDLIKAPLSIATDIIKLPFQIAGSLVAVPFDIAKGMASFLEPVIGKQLSGIIQFPLDFAKGVFQIPFQFGEKVVQLPYGLLSELAGWNWRSRQEMELAKRCCMSFGGLNAFYTYVNELRQASAVCESKLAELTEVVNNILNKPACPNGFYYSGTTKRCYAVFGNPSTYDDGQKICAGVGGVLASIRSQEEQDLIESIANSLPKSGVCTCNRGGSCYTTSGQNMDPNLCGTGSGRLVWKPKPGYYMEMGYTNWKSGEPNCYGNNEHCLVLDSYFNYQWNDYPCSTKTCPICEAEPVAKKPY